MSPLAPVVPEADAPLADWLRMRNIAGLAPLRCTRDDMTMIARSTTWRRQAVLYGVLLALGTALLQWLDYRWLARAHSFELYLLIVAGGFLAIGLWVGARVIGVQAPPRAPGNPEAQTSLGISAREMDVLREIAAGHANKVIARRLNVSPNTVKTHVARLFEKLGAQNRTDAVTRARELGLLA